ncbi:ParA family protein [Leucobacter sp. cx-169]|uniref:ParA family protein n=1 Tax=Leucobacter sp. cx-169 TaxID=2770549 RepID=UPI00165E9A1A|nr:ParA family protein [Leucobacter sp. cx-169]MBC9927339.1 AAA family ATPase [Leucobacter sp. cx-169]
MGQSNFIGVIGPAGLIELLTGLGLHVFGGDQYPAHAHAIKGAQEQHGVFPVVVADLEGLGRISPWVHSQAQRTDVRVIPGPGGTLTGNPFALDLPITVAELLTDLGVPVALSDLADTSIGFGGVPAADSSPIMQDAIPTAADTQLPPPVDFDAPSPAPTAYSDAHRAPVSEPVPADAPHTPSPEVTRAAAVPSEAPPAVSPGAGPSTPAWLTRMNAATKPPTQPVAPGEATPTLNTQVNPAQAAAADADVLTPSPLPEFARPRPKLTPEPIPSYVPAQPEPVPAADAQPIQQWTEPAPAPAPAPVPAPAPAYVAPQQPVAQPSAPWMQQTAQPSHQEPAATAPLAAPVMDPSEFFDRSNRQVIQHVQSQLNPQVIISWAAKGGVGKTSFALTLAEMAGLAGLRACVVDANRGQANIRRYTRATNAQLPSIYDAVRGGWRAAVVSAETLSAVRRAHGPVHFDTVFGPPDHLAAPEHTPASLYAEVIGELTREYDLVIIDTQIAEAHLTDLWLEVMIPQLRSGAWAFGLFDSSPPSLPDLKTIIASLMARGVSNARFIAIGNRWPAFSTDEGQFITQFLTGSARFLGTALEDEFFKDQSFGGFIPTSSETVRPVLNEALHQVTGDARFAPERIEPKKRGLRLFGRGAR